MISKSDNTKHVLSLTLFYAAFLFLWMTVLAPASRAGEGRLSVGQLERVYYVQQVFLILGFLTYAALRRLLSGRVLRFCSLFAAAVFFLGVTVLLFADKAKLFYLPVARAVILCLGSLGGAVYHDMSTETAKGSPTALCMGIASAAAVLLQFLLQIQWGQSPLLPLFMLAALLLLAYRLLSPVWLGDGAQTEAAEEPASEKVPPSRLLTACLISVLFLLFVCFYNEIIHHRTILSDSAAPGAYTWPRLMVIPCYLLFAAVGDKMQGRLVPLTALVIALAATLNAVLAGSSGASAWLNMCLFYCAVAATVSYYTLTFWRLAPGTRHPALWACMGRVLDSAMVLVTAAVRLDTLPPAAVMGLDLAGVALIILMMALSGDFNLNAAIAAEAPTAVEVPAVPEAPVSLSPEETLEKMRQRYSLTPRETEVLRELVMTEDKQTAIAEHLSIRVKTLQDYVTRLYRKTGAATRAGLTDLYHENRQQQ